MTDAYVQPEYPTVAPEIGAAPFQAEQPVDLAQPAGVAHGTELISPNGERERIVHDLDEAGELIGWHKEVVA